ncbi:saccharopine dehydrogenase [bacterium]|nr:MAG: saccharopine dehydrogenase [bacterium]
MHNRPYDIIVFGATGFTGKLVVEYLIEHYGVNNELFTWAIAGRNEDKIKKVVETLAAKNDQIKKIKFFIADSFDDKSLDNLSKSAKLVISTVGPYIKYGKNLVSHCAHNGTHYCDLTGEVPFIRESIDAYDKVAKKNECRIIHSCGFDSIPSDLGVLFLQSEAKKKYDRFCSHIKYYVRATKGGFSGGTIASMIAISNYIKSKPNLSGLLGNPYALNSDNYESPSVSSLRSVEWDQDVGLWTAPFIMSGINTRVVRRSNELLGFKYGKEFIYTEVTSFQKGIMGYLKSYSMLIFLGLTKFLMSFKPTFWLLKNFYLPSPGEGPNKEKRDNGFFKILLNGYVDGNHISCTVTGDKDPGYSGTAIMLTESALSIILNNEEIPKKFGVLTPASAIGKILIKRLKTKGIIFKVN